ncbi:MAG: hypothetical protein K2H64_01020, partial [Desulfovibrio sp.]|nr:hypothetical protein [Desulfovibrio sp.]
MYYERPVEDAGVRRPFVFQGKPYSSTHDLAPAFAAGYKESKSGMGMLARSNVAKWLQNNGDFDEEAVLADEIADNDPGLYLFKFIRHYAPESPFALYGRPVTPKNVPAWLRDGPDEAEEKIISLFKSGKIKEYFALLPDGPDPLIAALADADWRRDLT